MMIPEEQVRIVIALTIQKRDELKPAFIAAQEKSGNPDFDWGAYWELAARMNMTMGMLVGLYAVLGYSEVEIEKVVGSSDFSGFNFS